jgi:hypothetical protein
MKAEIVLTLRLLCCILAISSCNKPENSENEAVKGPFNLMLNLYAQI